MNARALQAAIKADINALFSRDQFKTPEFLTDDEVAALEPDNLDPETEEGRTNLAFWEGMKLDWNRHRMAAPKAYEQFLPKRRTQDAEDPFPYVIVRIDSGGIDTQTDPHKVAVILVIGIYDDDPDNQGHKAVLEIIERIQEHYEGTPLLAGQFTFDDPFNWALQDEQSWPYFYGACNLTFKLPPPRTKASDLV